VATEKTTLERRGGGRRAKAGRSSGSIPQLPWQRVVNCYAPMQLLDEEQMETLHRTSMRILSELGIRVMSAKGTGFLRDSRRHCRPLRRHGPYR